MPLSFEYSLTGAGCSAARISDGTNAAELTASYVSDALADLIRSVTVLATGAPEALCSWEVEPGEYRWIFINNDGQVQLTIIEFDERRAYGPDENGVVVFSTAQPLRNVVRRVVMAADSVLELHGPDGYREQWRHQFPIDDLERLRKELRRSE